MLVQIVGFRFWGGIVDRYGSKPVLQVLMVPRMLWPALWLLVTPGDYMIVLPVIMVFSGLTISGLTASVSPLLYGLVPEQEEKAAYFASWSFTSAIVAAIGPAIGALLIRRLEWVSINISPTNVYQMVYRFQGRETESGLASIPMFRFRSGDSLMVNRSSPPAAISSCVT